MEKPKITLIASKDGTKVEVDPKGIRLSTFLKNLVEEYSTDTEFQIPEITGSMLTHIGIFLNHYVDEDPIVVPKPLPVYDIAETYGKWEDEFINTFTSDKRHLWELMEAANYLDCRPLLELSASKSACMIKDMNGQEMLNYFELKEDMTDEDIKKMEEEYEKERQAEKDLQKTTHDS